MDYYARLEQGRGPHPSRQVLGALVLACEVLDVAVAGQKVIFYTAEAGSHTAWVLCSLRLRPAHAV